VRLKFTRTTPKAACWTADDTTFFKPKVTTGGGGFYAQESPFPAQGGSRLNLKKSESLFPPGLQRFNDQSSSQSGLFRADWSR
jgi:hypothetical protein